MIFAAVAEAREFVSRLKPVPTVVFLATGLCLWAYHYYGSNEFFTDFWDHRFLKLTPRDDEAGGYFYWYGSAFVLLMLIPWIALRVTTHLSEDEKVATVGLGLGNWRLGVPAALFCYAVMLGILSVIVWSGDFQEAYPLYLDADRTPEMLVAYELAYAVYFVAWEFFFRGFMTFGLEKTLGVWTVFVQMVPFAVMHFGKPDLEAMSSVFGGIALGWLALRTRSIWYGVFIHAATAVSLDLLVLAMKHWGPP